MAYAESRSMLLKLRTRDSNYLRYKCFRCSHFGLHFVCQDMGEDIGEDGELENRRQWKIAKAVLEHSDECT